MIGGAVCTPPWAGDSCSREQLLTIIPWVRLGAVPIGGTTTMLSSDWFRVGLLLAALGLFAVATTPAIGREPRAHGKSLVAQYQLPPDAIARYAAMAAGTDQNVTRREDSMFADRLPWVGPKHRAGVGHNPYTLVFTVSGLAKAAGEVQAHWQAGWEIQESPVASRELVMAVPRLARAGVAAGQPVTLTASSTRVSFRGERHVAPMLGLVQMRNLDISDVHLQVWSGEAANAWTLPTLPRGVLVAMGLACLVLAARFSLGRLATPAPILEPRLSRLPRADVIDRPVVVVEMAPATTPLLLPAPAARPTPVEAMPSQQARVMAALQHVLTVGLAVPTVLDRKRMRRGHAPQ